MSQSVEAIKEFPFIRLLNYYRNHHLTSFVPTHPHLYVKHGYHTYLDAAVEPDNITVHLNRPVRAVSRTKSGVQIRTATQTENFDAVIMACEADIALQLQTQSTALEQELLSPFTYKINTGYLHQDTDIMPTHKNDWATHTSHLSHDESQGCHSIWLNQILRLNTPDTFLMTLNPFSKLSLKTIIAPLRYRHLRVSTEVIRAQRRLMELNQHGPIYYAGSYYKYFHEDAVRSANAVVAQILKC